MTHTPLNKQIRQERSTVYNEGSELSLKHKSKKNGNAKKFYYSFYSFRT